MKRENNAVFMEMDLAPIRAKMEPFFKSLISEGAISQRVYDKVKSLEKAE